MKPYIHTDKLFKSRTNIMVPRTTIKTREDVASLIYIANKTDIDYVCKRNNVFLVIKK